MHAVICRSMWYLEASQFKMNVKNEKKKYVVQNYWENLRI